MSMQPLKLKDLNNNTLLNRLARKAHAHTIHNATEILEHSKVCGCCNCERIYEVSELGERDIVTELEGEPTVWCPYCGIDAVFGDGCGVRPTSSLLRRMYNLYFN